MGKIVRLLTVSTGNRVRTERWAGPWDSLTAILDMLVGCHATVMHQTRHGHLGVDCDISCFLWGKDPGSHGLISAQATFHFITLAVGLNILPYMSHILKYLLDMGLGCCHNILNQIREVMLTSVTRQRLACSGCYFSSSLECERVKKLPETLLLLRQEN